MVNQSSLVQIMRETLIYLSHLDHEDTEKQVMYLMAGVLLMFLGIIISKYYDAVLSLDTFYSTMSIYAA